jgi:hypothetical protein
MPVSVIKIEIEDAKYYKSLIDSEKITENEEERNTLRKQITEFEEKHGTNYIFALKLLISQKIVD